MQLEQQESFTIHGPQLEVFGELETRLPAPAKKRPVAGLVLAVAILLSVFGIGGLRLKAQYNDTREIYTSAVDEYGHGIQTDFSAQADAAASMIRVAGGVLGADDPTVAVAQDWLDAWNLEAAAKQPATQYDLNGKLYTAIDQLYNTAYPTADATQQGQLDDLYDRFLSAQATIDRAGAAYNAEADAYNAVAEAFPASLVGPLWGAGHLDRFATGG